MNKLKFNIINLVDRTFTKYIFAVAASALVIVAKLLFIDILDAQAPFLIMLFAPIISAMYGGFGPGLVSILISTALEIYIFFLPSHASASIQIAHYVQASIYVVQGLIILWLIDKQFKQSRRVERLALAIRSSDDAIISKDTGGKILSWNKGAEIMYGYKPSEIIGKNISLLFPKGRKNEFKNIMSSILKGTKIEHFETARVKKDGEMLIVSVTISPMTLKNGQVIGAVTIARDITEQKRLRDELQRANESLESKVKERTAELNKSNEELLRSNKELEDFAYVASHDLQEPLRKIQSFGNLLNEEYQEKILGDGSLYILRMLSAAGRMRALIDDLLAFSRVTTKAQPFVAVNLNKIIQDVLADLEIRIVELNGRVQIDNLPIIFADPLQMRQIFQNLISNALKFHRKNVNPIIYIYSDQSLKGSKFDKISKFNSKRFARIFVEDNGIGFDEKYKDRIFTIFERLHSRQEYEGTGIGLAVVKKIVDRHGGTIQTKSTPNQGAVFIIDLPKFIKGGETRDNYERSNNING